MSRTIAIVEGNAVLTRQQRTALSKAADLIAGLMQVYYDDEAIVGNLISTVETLRAHAREPEPTTN